MTAGYEGPPPNLYRVPGLGWRILVGTLRLIPLLILLVGLPGAALAFLDSHGIALPVSILAVTIAGAAMTALSTARYIARPTRLFGPLSIASGAVVLIYLLYLWSLGSYTFNVPHAGIALTVNYAKLVELLLIVPALSIAAGVVTTFEDLLHPRERLPFDFPP